MKTESPKKKSDWKKTTSTFGGDVLECDNHTIVLPIRFIGRTKLDGNSLEFYEKRAKFPSMRIAFLRRINLVDALKGRKVKITIEVL